MSALILCSLIIYGIAAMIIPTRHTVISNNRLNNEIEALEKQLRGVDSETASGMIYDFCIKHQISAMLTIGEESQSYGDFETMNGTDNFFSTTILPQIADKEETSFLTFVSPPDDLNETFFEMIPLVAVIILIISSLSALLCSRVIVRPVVNICNVSKRMAKLDMTWRCDVNRSDELGILSDSLNTLSLKLGEAMENLELTNKQLRHEVERVKEAERRQRDFFAAASHELKTPVTVLKGQIESMILEIGRYKDIKSVLPETLLQVEKTENLIKEILSVSKLEIKGLDGKNEMVNINRCLRSAVKSVMPLADEKNTDIDTDIIRKEIFTEGSEVLFGKALNNILSNAVFHSPENSRISVRLDENTLTVVNTNAYIPEEELPLLFVPFYRVEKSRNKDTGGSGLGLYLTENILKLHGLSFGIANGENEVIFTIELNRK